MGRQSGLEGGPTQFVMEEMSGHTLPERESDRDEGRGRTIVKCGTAVNTHASTRSRGSVGTRVGIVHMLNLLCPLYTME